MWGPEVDIRCQLLYLPYVQRPVSHCTQISDLPSLAIQLALGVSCLSLPTPGSQAARHTHLAFMWVLDPNSDFHACPAST